MLTHWKFAHSKPVVWFKVIAVVGAVLFGTVLYGEDITSPLADGSIVVQAAFIRRGIVSSYAPYLSYRIMNQTSSSWRTIKLRFDMGALCNGELRQWSVPIATSVGWDKDFKAFRVGEEYVNDLVSQAEGCNTEIIKATLLLAEDANSRSIVAEPSEPVDLSEQLTVIKNTRDAEAAAEAEKERLAEGEEAERQRIADEQQAKKDAFEAARQKRLAAERKRRQAEDNARYAKYKAEEEAKQSDERAKIRAACWSIYKATSDKKMGDLTVKEDQQVRACQGLGLYPPR